MSELEHIATLIERLVESNQVLCDRLAAIEQKVAIAPSEVIDKSEAAKVLGCSTRTLEQYRKQWQEGIHFFPQGKGHLYNRVLLEDWRINRFDSQAHERAIARWCKAQSRK